jgi:16S rRNA (cytidine1402-2'-O)-methyltransferase
MFDALLSSLCPATRLCVAAGITTAQEYIRTHTVQEWKRTTLPELKDIPAIFLIGK